MSAGRPLRMPRHLDLGIGPDRQIRTRVVRDQREPWERTRGGLIVDPFHGEPELRKGLNQPRGVLLRIEEADLDDFVP